MTARRIPTMQYGWFPEVDPGDYWVPVSGLTGDNPAVFFLTPYAMAADAPNRARSV